MFVLLDVRDEVTRVLESIKDLYQRKDECQETDWGEMKLLVSCFLVLYHICSGLVV